MGFYVAAIDCGTTRIKSGIVDQQGHIRGLATRPGGVIAGPDNTVEVDPRALVRGCLGALREALRKSGVRRGKIEGLAVTNQRATLFFLGRDGDPIGNGISWQDMRGNRSLQRVRRTLSDKGYFSITGLPINPVFTLAKILWVQSREPGRWRRTERVSLVQDFVLARLGARDACCDVSNASMTGLLDVRTLMWSRPLLDLCRVGESRLPRLALSGQRIGSLSAAAAAATGLPEGLPLISGGGDQQCAGIGAGAVEPGLVEIAMGTAAAPLCYAVRAALDRHMRVTCCAHAIPHRWEIEGLQSSAGASLEWLARIATRGGAHFNESFAEEVGRIPPGAGGIIFLPYLSGASAPHWIPEARGAFLGLRLGQGSRELARAVLEGVSMQTREILDVFRGLRLPVREIRLTGGGTAFEPWNQIQADIFGMPVSVPESREATLMGAAILAAAGIGAVATIAEGARLMVRLRKTYRPEAEQAAAYEVLYRRFRAVHAAFRKGGVFGVVSRKGGGHE